MIAFIVAASLVESRAMRLESMGLRYPGTIVEVQQSRGFGSGSLVVEFQERGVRRRASITLNDSSPAYEVDSPTVVLVDRNDPKHLSIEGETNQSNPTVIPMIALLIAGLFGTTGGIGGLLRASRQASILHGSAWVLRHGSFAPSQFFPRIALYDGGRTTSLALCMVFNTTPAKAGIVGATQFFVAGDPSGYCVVRVPYSDRMLSARPPRLGH